jgi:hypothetical protein
MSKRVVRKSKSKSKGKKVAKKSMTKRKMSKRVVRKSKSKSKGKKVINRKMSKRHSKVKRGGAVRSGSVVQGKMKP